MTTAATITLSWQFNLHDGPQQLVWSPDGQWLAAVAVSGPIALLEGYTGAHHLTLPGHAVGTLHAAWSKDSQQLLTGGQDGQARLWEVATGRTLHTVAGTQAWIGQVSFAPSDRSIVIAAGKSLIQWHLDRQMGRQITPHTSTITALAWHPHQPLLASVAYAQAHLWDFQNPDAPTERCLPHPTSLLTAHWSPDGRYLVSGCQDRSIRIWTWPDCTDWYMSGYASKVRELAWDARSRWLATGDGARIVVWDFASGPPDDQVPLEIHGLLDTVSEVAFHPSQPVLAAVDRMGVIGLWRVRVSGARPLWTQVLKEAGQIVAWHPHGDRLAVGDVTGRIYVFETVRLAFQT